MPDRTPLFFAIVFYWISAVCAMLSQTTIATGLQTIAVFSGVFSVILTAAFMARSCDDR